MLRITSCSWAHAVVLTQHGAVVTVVECLTSQTDVWKARLEARSRSDMAEKVHKPQNWEAVQNLIAG